MKRYVRSPREIEYVVTALERETPPPNWPLLAGEAVQNLRSALDHAVYALTSKKYRGSSQFPIFKEPQEFQTKGLAMIRGLPEPQRTLIENAQPYQLMPTRPELHPLAVLNRLSNWDKHRVLNTVATAVRFQWIGLEEGIRVEAIQPFAQGQPLHDGAHIAHFIARSDSEIHETQVDPSFRYEVRIEGHPLLSTFVSIAQRVFEAVTECETGKPRTGGGDYPIYPIPAGLAIAWAESRRKRSAQALG